MEEAMMIVKFVLCVRVCVTSVSIHFIYLNVFRQEFY